MHRWQARIGISVFQSCLMTVMHIYILQHASTQKYHKCKRTPHLRVDARLCFALLMTLICQGLSQGQGWSPPTLPRLAVSGRQNILHLPETTNLWLFLVDIYLSQWPWPWQIKVMNKVKLVPLHLCKCHEYLIYTYNWDL